MKSKIYADACTQISYDIKILLWKYRTSDKSSTWFPPEQLVEQESHYVQTNRLYKELHPQKLLDYLRKNVGSGAGKRERQKITFLNVWHVVFEAGNVIVGAGKRNLQKIT